MSEQLPEVGHLYGDPQEPWNQWYTCVAIENGRAEFRSIYSDREPWFVQIANWPGFSGACEVLDITRAVASLRPKPAETGETVRVRAAVAMNAAKEAIVFGYDKAAVTDREICQEARRVIGHDVPIVAFIEADIPLPRVPVVEASVQRSEP